MPDSLEDDLYVHDVYGQKSMLGKNEEDDKIGLPQVGNSHKDQSLDDDSSSARLLWKSDDNCEGKSESISELAHSSIIFCQKFPLEPEVISGVVEENLPTSQQKIGSVEVCLSYTAWWKKKLFQCCSSLRINYVVQHCFCY